MLFILLSLINNVGEVWSKYGGVSNAGPMEKSGHMQETVVREMELVTGWKDVINCNFLISCNRYANALPVFLTLLLKQLSFELSSCYNDNIDLTVSNRKCLIKSSVQLPRNWIFFDYKPRIINSSRIKYLHQIISSDISHSNYNWFSINFIAYYINLYECKIYKLTVGHFDDNLKCVTSVH